MLFSSYSSHKFRTSFVPRFQIAIPSNACNCLLLPILIFGLDQAENDQALQYWCRASIAMTIMKLRDTRLCKMVLLAGQVEISKSAYAIL